MGTRKFLTLMEVEEMVNDPNFLNGDDDESETIDIVALPPENVDVVSDVEDIDENVLEDTQPKDVPGNVEIHSSALPVTPTVVTPTSVTPTVVQQLDEEREPVRKIQKTANIRNPKTKSISNWQTTKPDFSEQFDQNDDVLKSRENMIRDLKGKSPVEVFEILFDEDVMTYIVQQSVRYASQNNRHNFTFSVNCFRKFLGFLFLTGYHSLPQEQMYWCEDEDVSIECVRKCLTKNRYLEIKRNLHFNDNAELNDQTRRNKSFKISPLIEKMNEQFLKFGIFSRYISIDEQMVRYYGHHFLKQFIRAKPIRFGFKQWAMCCAETGYCFHAELYEGKQDDQCVVNGLGASVILRNISVVDNPSNHVFYFDNFFTSFELMKILTDRNIAATGTVRYNRMNHCPVKTDSEMKKEERGVYDYRLDVTNKIFATVWKDNNIVKMLSNHQGVEPSENVGRWSRTEKKKVKVQQPFCIHQYNKYMGGVDKLDWNVNKYRIKIRGKKWYFPIFTNMMDLTLVNAHALYCIANGNIPLLEFRRSVARAYLQTASLSNPKSAGRPHLRKLAKNRVHEFVRKDPIGHFLERTDEGKQRKCAICKTNVRKQCAKCNVGLHVECMIEWHK